ncbi:MAG: lamin tail domain-containing protein [Chitinophagales bacterium]|nr:lamin tail domain-containing protein [Chitinophagales bacterium]
MKKLLPSAFLFFLSVITIAQPCSDLFISEYVEGGSNNKAIEIFNPTATGVDLTGYKIQLYTNGSATATSTLNLAGTVAAGDVYVVVNSQASAAIKATRDTTSSGVTAFNGNDAVALLNGTTIIDLIGQTGTNPGTEWTVGNGSTLNHTLVRMISIQEGSDDWAINSQQWDVLPQDSIQLGAHTMTSCGVPADTTVRFMPVSATVAEAAGTYTITLVLNQAATADKTVDIEVRVGDVADIGNFTTTSVTISANSTSASYSLTVTNDTIAEGSEELQFVLRNPSAGLLLAADSVFGLTILDDDSIAPPSPFYSIATVTAVDSVGVADSIGVQCRVSGVVYGINLRNTGFQFTIQDGTGGIGVFSSSNTFGYTVEEGDSIVVSGVVEQFNGYTQMESLDTIYEVGSGILLQPTNTTVLDESTESELVRINNLTLVNPSQWDNSNLNGFTVDVTNGTQTFELRIEEQVDLFNQNAPTSSFDVIGLGSQFDNSSPYTSGYQILPRYSADLLLRTAVNEISGNIFQIFPNPNEGIFTLNVQVVQEQRICSLIDFTGKVVFKAAVAANETTLNIDASHLPAGIYAVEILSKTAVERSKLSIR